MVAVEALVTGRLVRFRESVRRALTEAVAAVTSTAVTESAVAVAEAAEAAVAETDVSETGAGSVAQSVAAESTVAESTVSAQRHGASVQVFGLLLDRLSRGASHQDSNSQNLQYTRKKIRSSSTLFLCSCNKNNYFEDRHVDSRLVGTQLMIFWFKCLSLYTSGGERKKVPFASVYFEGRFLSFG